VPDAHLIGGGMWLVSDRLKALFERLDPEALVFQRTEVDYSNFSQTGSTYWLSYFIRELDCVDEEQSALTYYDCIQGVKVYRDLFDIKMRPEAIGSAHAFRLKYGTDNSIVDDLVVSTMNVEGITGFKFVPIQKN